MKGVEHFWYNRAGNGPDADQKIEVEFSADVPQQRNEAPEEGGGPKCSDLMVSHSWEH